jgi:hypothetical protein
MGKGPALTSSTCRRSLQEGRTRCQQRQPLAGGDQHADVAVAQDVGDLIRLEQGVEGYEDAAGGGAAKTGDDGFRPLLEVDGDPLSALQAEADQAADEALDRLLQHRSSSTVCRR